MRAGATLILDKFIPPGGRCQLTQQPDEVAYIPKTPAWVQGPATAGGGATARKGAERSNTGKLPLLPSRALAESPEGGSLSATPDRGSAAERRRTASGTRPTGSRGLPALE